MTSAQDRAKKIVDEWEAEINVRVMLGATEDITPRDVLIDAIAKAFEENPWPDSEIDLWKGRHVTDGVVCLTCHGIALKDCPVIGRMSRTE